MSEETNIDVLQQSSGTISSCSLHACINDEDQYKLECDKCNRYVHYRCTELPLYQLSQFLIKGYRKYHCTNCVHVPEYLVDLPKIPSLTTNQERTMADLTIAIKQCNEENETHTINCLALTKRNTQLTTEFNKQLEATQRDQKELSKLQSDIETYANSVKYHEETEMELKRINSDQRRELEEQQQKFEEIGNPEYDTLHELENSMKKKLDQVGKSLEDKLLRQIEDNNRKMDEKLSEVLTHSKTYAVSSTDYKQIDQKLDEVMKHSKTYAESVKNMQSAGVQTGQSAAAQFRSIIEETKNKQLAEESNQKVRSCNLIIHGVQDGENTDKAILKKTDEEFVNYFISALSVGPVAFKAVFRIGNADANKNRPIKVVMNNEEAKNKIMENLRNLQGQEDFKGVSITDDYTISERRLIKEWTDKAKSNNEKEPADSKYIWRVRGTPKNGLQLKKLLKQRTPTLKIGV